MKAKIRVMAAAAALLLAVIPAKADTPFTVTGWLAKVPVPGALCSNAQGQVYLKGNVHVVRSLASVPITTGRLTAWMDVGYQADGTGLFAGPACLETGTWDAAGTNFTPNGGVWVMNYRGVAQADNSDQISMTGYGVGSGIDGMRFECALTRAAGPVFDPTIPYEGSGTIKPAPLVITDPIDESQAPGWPNIGGPAGKALIGTNQQLTICTPYPGTWASPERATAVTPGHTLEARFDLVGMSGPGSVVLGIYHTGATGYWLEKAGDHVGVGKQTPAGMSMTYYKCERVVTGNTNVVLALAITPSGLDNILTARVLDRANQGVLYETSFTDTPGSDPSLSAAQVQAICGATWFAVINDPAGTPWRTFSSPWLGLMMHTDGTSGEAVFDHFETRNYEIPPLGIARAVQLGWPCPAGVSYSVERAPTVLGPWLPVSGQTAPGMQQLAVPSTKAAEYFRLQLAP